MNSVNWTWLVKPDGRRSPVNSMRCRLKSALLLTGLAVSAWFAMSPSYAADSEIGVTGEVYAEACTIDAGSDLEIDFGSLFTSELRAAGMATAWVNASKKIELSCPAGTRTVTARFDGAADAAAPDTFKIGGTAKNVSIELQLQNGTAIAPGALHGVTVASGKAEYALRARLYTKSGGAEAGTVSSTASFTLSYQ